MKLHYAEHLSSLKLQTSLSGLSKLPEAIILNIYSQRASCDGSLHYNFKFSFLFLDADYVKKNIKKLPSWNARQEHQFEVTFSEYNPLEFPSL